MQGSLLQSEFENSAKQIINMKQSIQFLAKFDQRKTKNLGQTPYNAGYIRNIVAPLKLYHFTNRLLKNKLDLIKFYKTNHSSQDASSCATVRSQLQSLLLPSLSLSPSPKEKAHQQEAHHCLAFCH